MRDSDVKYTEIFQSTLPRRERLCQISYNIYVFLFQSTLPRRERHVRRCLWKYWYDFNPRSREGSDTYNHNITRTFRDFNPRSREGSDIFKDGHSCHCRTKFQSTLPRRERQIEIYPQFRSMDISIHAPAKGAT